MRALIAIAVVALAPPAKGATITVQTIEGGDPVVVVDGPFEHGDQFEFFCEASDLDNALICSKAMAAMTKPPSTSG